MTPNFLKNKLTEQYGEEASKEICTSYETPRKTTIRVNTLKTTPVKIKTTLDENNIKYSIVPWSDFSLIIENTDSESLRNLDIYKEGEIYLQSLSSQLPPLFLNPKSNETILDMTAAPGGKTTEIAALTNNEAMITALEKNKQRFERLKYNIEHLGAKKVTVLNTDSRNLDKYFIFDKILLDAPCSGTGTLYGKSLENFNEELVNRSVKTQKTLIEEAIQHLRVGGELIYSTCSILKDENDSQIEEVLRNHPDMELIPLDLNNFHDLPLLPNNLAGTICVKPNLLYEGFYVAKLRKNK